MDREPGGAREPADYLSYLLRLWQEGMPGRTWRASLESVATGERRGFAGLEDLFDFLRRQTDADTGAQADRREDK